MVNYKDYLQELTAAFNAYSDLSAIELNKLSIRYNNEERAIKEKFDNRMKTLRLELSSSVEKIDREIASVQRKRGSVNKSLDDELLELREEENTVTSRYNKLNSIASEKSRKRAEIGKNPFRLWWYSSDSD